MEEAGGALEDGEEGVVEVAPLVSYAGEGLAAMVEGRTFHAAYCHELQVWREGGQRRARVLCWGGPRLPRPHTHTHTHTHTHSHTRTQE